MQTMIIAIVGKIFEILLKALFIPQFKKWQRNKRFKKDFERRQKEAGQVQARYDQATPENADDEFAKLPIILLVCLGALSACRSSPDMRMKQISENCSPVFIYVDETRKLIDADQSYCNVRQYEFSIDKVGPIQGTNGKKPLSYCDRCTGFKNYAQTVTFLDDVRKLIVIDDAQEDADVKQTLDR